MIDEIKSLPNIMGLIGVMIILLAYFLLQIEKWSSSSLPYSIFNFIGALLIACSLFFNWNLPAFVMEVLWALISLGGIVRAWLKIQSVK